MNSCTNKWNETLVKFVSNLLVPALLHFLGLIREKILIGPISFQVPILVDFLCITYKRPPLRLVIDSKAFT